MSTPKQIAANRLNSQKATGPGATEGKAVSRFNSLKHNIFAIHQYMFDETAADLAHLTAECHEHHTPSNPEEWLLVETLIASEWRLRRMRRIEIHFWEDANITFQVKNLFKVLFEINPCSGGEAFLTDSTNFERLQRVVNSCERDYHRALKDLVARAHGRRAPQPQRSTAGSANLVPPRNNPQNAAVGDAQSHRWGSPGDFDAPKQLPPHRPCGAPDRSRDREGADALKFATIFQNCHA
jgi:hypothetical protein